VEEVRKMRAQMAASDDDEDSDILPMVAGSSKSKSKSKETPARIASVGTAEAKPHHLPTGTAAAVEEEEEEEVSLEDCLTQHLDLCLRILGQVFILLSGGVPLF
jgi:hypothetical protein